MICRFQDVKDLVGNITKEDLKYVDYYVISGFGVFIPTVGHCKYAISVGHDHPSYSFVICLSDSLFKSSIKVNRDEYIAHSIYPKFPHEETKGEKFNRYISIMISKELYENEYIYYKNFIRKYDIKTFKIKKDIMNYIGKFICEFENTIPNKENVLKNIMNIIINDLIRAQVGEMSESRFIKSYQIDKSINYMHQNYSDKITISQLASLSNMSKTSFINTFKKEMSCSAIEYLITIRIDKAKKLLRSDTKNITEIALECGFSSLAHFSTCFLKKTGINPKEYLKRYK